MHFIIILAVVAIATAVPSYSTVSEWNQFKLAHNKVYDAQEERLRFQTFSDNLGKIQAHNVLYKTGLETYEMGVNKFADLTQEEFRNYLTLSGPNPLLKKKPLGVHEYNSTIQLPESVDYRDQNAVNPIKNQESCGSCWAFSAVGSLESINFLQKGNLLSLSEQNLVDCSRSYGNAGCGGGWMETSFDYIRDNGLQSEQDYPYKAYDSNCKFDKSKSVITVRGHTNIEHSESALQSAVATVGPVSVAVDATLFQFYSSGIFSANSFYGLNHGVVAVGYGSQSGVEYWIVRNSWGPGWGENGYIRIKRNAGNQVGITDAACYPVL